MRIYLDCCALNRPWDDQGQIRIHREAESVLFLIEEARGGRMDLVSSDYLLNEIRETADEERQQKVRGLLDAASIHVPASQSLADRAAAFAAHGITGSDALHLATAEAAGARYLITTDDRLLKRAHRAGRMVQVQVINPTDWPPSESMP